MARQSYLYEELIEMFNYRDDDELYMLCKNPNITMDFVNKHKDWNWNFDSLTTNPSISWDYMKSNPQFEWNYKLVSFNPTLTWEEYHKNKDMGFNWSIFCSSGQVKWEEHVKKYPELDWDWLQLSKNPNITVDIIAENLDKRWDWHLLSANRTLTWDFITSHAHLPWDYYNLSGIPCVTLDIMARHPDQNWNMYNFVMRNTSNSFDEIYQFISSKPYDWKLWKDFCYNPVITPEIIESCSTVPYQWDYGSLSSNPSMTPEYIMKNSQYHWCKYGISWNRFLYTDPCTGDYVYDRYMEKLTEKRDNISTLFLEKEKIYSDIINTVTKYVS